MMGETVTVYTRTETGKDAFNAATYEWAAAEVENCLVLPVSTENLGEDRPDGITVEFRVAFPKTYEGPSLRGTRIALTGRGAEADPESALLVAGEPAITQPCPTAWNMLVDAGRAYG